MSVLDFIKKQDKNTIITTIVLIVVVIAGAILYFSPTTFSGLNVWSFGDKKTAESTISYINDNQLASSPASLVSFSRESGVLKIKIKIGETEFDSYVTTDGKLLFPQAIEMIKSEEKTENTVSATSCDELTKSDSPMLEAYVVAMCPYGLQMQRAMADAVQRVPELANYIKARYIGSVSGNTIVSMHGGEEATENLRQICIREEQSDKYWNYISCFIKAGDASGCQSSTGVDSAKLSSCISDTSRGVAYASEDFDLAESFGVSGSPTLILGDAKLDESGFGGRSSDAVKSIICCASNNQPDFCSQTLNTASAAAGYSVDYSSGNSTNTANCE
jgi:hypothetical protein